MASEKTAGYSGIQAEEREIEVGELAARVDVLTHQFWTKTLSEHDRERAAEAAKKGKIKEAVDMWSAAGMAEASASRRGAVKAIGAFPEEKFENLSSIDLARRLSALAESVERKGYAQRVGREERPVFTEEVVEAATGRSERNGVVFVSMLGTALAVGKQAREAKREVAATAAGDLPQMRSREQMHSGQGRLYAEVIQKIEESKRSEGPDLTPGSFDREERGYVLAESASDFERSMQIQKTLREGSARLTTNSLQQNREIDFEAFDNALRKIKAAALAQEVGRRQSIPVHIEEVGREAGVKSGSIFEKSGETEEDSSINEEAIRQEGIENDRSLFRGYAFSEEADQQAEAVKERANISEGNLPGLPVRKGRGFVNRERFMQAAEGVQALGAIYNEAQKSIDASIERQARQENQKTQGRRQEGRKSGEPLQSEEKQGSERRANTDRNRKAAGVASPIPSGYGR